MKNSLLLALLLTAISHSKASVELAEGGSINFSPRTHLPNVGIITNTQNTGTDTAPYTVSASDSRTMASASMFNTLGSASLLASGSISGSRDTNNVSSYAVCNDWWDIRVNDEAATMSLSGTFTPSGSGVETPKFSILVYASTANSVVYNPQDLNGSGSFSVNLYLAPGTYYIRSTAKDQGNFSNTWSYSASFSAVPEPSALAFGLLGCGLLLTRRTRNRRLTPMGLCK